MPPDASQQALKAAKALVAYIEYFRTHGTGDVMRRYPDDDHFGGYGNILRRADELVAQIESFDGGLSRRLAGEKAAADQVAV